MSIVFVVLVRSMTTFTKSPIGKTNAAIGDAQAIDAEPGQPTSITLSWIPKFETIACAAGPRLSTSKPTTKFIPTKPTPIVKPERNAVPAPVPKPKPIIKMKTGRITVGPSAKKACTIVVTSPTLVAPFKVPTAIDLPTFFVDKPTRRNIVGRGKGFIS